MVRVDDTFEYVKINVASPEKIKKWSQRRIGNFIIACEVTRPETINYRTFKPEMDGLFCERCGVEITESRIRRHRMAHINLMYPVTHIWYLQGIPSYLTLLLDTTRYKLKRVIYFNDIKGNETLQTSKKLKETNGSDLLIKLLNKLNLKLQINFSRIEIINTSEIRRERLIKRIRILENFLSTGTNPIWMILFVLPILPPGLRPMVQLEGGRFATSDLNELYRRVITRNNRLKRFFEIYAPEIIVRNEKRLLQEAVDALIDNGKCEKKSVGLNTRPLKSLSDILAGKQGRFRQNLLGKRVDYSGRSIIVVDPYLKLNQCGLPYEMAIELFQPFIIYELIYEGLAPNMQLAKKLIGQNSLVLVKLVNKILNGFPILLNRAPTLHRLGIQAFEPKIIEGRAIKLHPLVCPSFNADFDGDQMAIHIPLSIEAQTEAYLLMLAPNNLMALTINEPIVLPSQDIVLGCHYLTILNNKADHPNYYFHDFDAVIVALDHNIINLHSIIWVKYSGPIQFDRTSFFIKSYNIENTISIDLYTNYQIRRNNFGEITSNYILTTPGRIILNRLVSNILIN